jgi:thiol:disulfide interchange protein DsbC
MTMHRIIALALFGLMITAILVPVPADADESTDRIRAALAARLPGMAIETVTASPIKGLYEVGYSGGVLYVSENGRYAVSGKLIDLETKENLTARTLAKQKLRSLAAMPESDMIVFEATGKSIHTITTFTDIDCPYCRKMHNEMAQLNASGIRVRYLLFPRAGIPSASYDKAVSVWCAADRPAAMTQAKSGAPLEGRTCENPISEHMERARELGLTGTPFTITDTGRVITGYMPAPALLESLNADKRKAVR